MSAYGDVRDRISPTNVKFIHETDLCQMESDKVAFSVNCAVRMPTGISASRSSIRWIFSRQSYNRARNKPYRDNDGVVCYKMPKSLNDSELLSGKWMIKSGNNLSTHDRKSSR